MIFNNALEMIGNTPLIEFKRLDTGPCRLFGKLEMLNPGGSIKDRIALKMIEAAEERGELKAGDTIIEATAGNTGLGLALVAAQKGYRLVLVIPDKMSVEKIHNCRAMGAEVLLTRSDVAKGHPEYYQDYAARLAKENNWFFINQFANPDNVLAHEEGTAPEIWQQMAQDVDAVVVGVGSSGTISGLTAFFRKNAPHVEIVLADPKGSVLANYIATGELGEKGSWLVEGIGEDFIPDICDLSGVKHAYSIPDGEAFTTARDLLMKEGIQAGSSSGTLLAAALHYCREQTEPKRVVTLVPDTGTRYVSKLYNDSWLFDLGFLQREQHNDLRDLISRLFEERATVVVGPTDTLATAHNRMRNNGYSQLPVMDGDTFLGVLAEGDIMHAVAQGNFNQPVSEAMNANFPVMPAERPLEQLIELLEMEPAVAITKDEKLCGLVTRSDILNYLRRQEEGKKAQD